MTHQDASSLRTGPLGPNYLTVQRLGMSAAVIGALRTGLLRELLAAGGTAADLARRVSLDPRATALVLDVLASVQLARRDGDRFAATEVLVAASQAPGGPAMALGLWAHTEEFLRTGEPFVQMDLGAEQRGQAYRGVVSGLGDMFEAFARDLAARLPIHPTKILDVGCGSGVWSLSIAERRAEVHVTGLDLPAVIENFHTRARGLSLSHRTAAITGDMHEEEIPAAAFDLAIIANVLRIDTPERAQRVVERAVRAVAPGGSVLVVDALAGGTPERELGRNLYALNLGLRTRTGQVHHPDTISRWLADAGCTGITAVDVADGAGGLGGLLAIKNPMNDTGGKTR